VIQLQAAGQDKTRIILDQHGWGEDEKWDAVYH
jgi:hypothetical protein